MEFFDKLRVTLSSPLKSHYSDSRDFKTWTLHAQGLKVDNIRLLLYRDCDRRGRKCLFDSAHVVKDNKTGKFTYIPVTNTGQVKDLSEWIFGCVPLSSSSTKRFHRWKGNLIWSHTFQAPATGPRYKTTYSRNVYNGSSSCLSSNGDLTSSGYMSGSGIDDSSYDHSSTDSSRNWSLPVMNPTGTSDLKMSHSLPSRLEVPVTKTLLGLAIVISTGGDDGDEQLSRDNYNREQVGAYISCMSSTLELSTDWFATVAIQSYMNPPVFVETLYNFCEEYRQLFVSRVTTPLVNINSIPVTIKTLPASFGEFLTLYMTNDLSWIKHYRTPRRCKIVIIAGSKRVNEVKTIFMLLKLINRCSCSKVSLPVNANRTSLGLSPMERVTVDTSQQRCPSHRPAVKILERYEEVSPTKDEVGLDVVAMNPEDFTRRTEDSKLLTRESTKDSGIYSISSSNSLKRSSTSSKFLSNLPPSVESLDGKMLDDFGVCFHLGEESDTEQTFNTLGLSEPNPDKLKQPLSVLDTLNSDHSSNKISPSLSETSEQDDNLYSVDCTDSIREPVKVELNLSNPTNNLTKFCHYCDSISIVDKFNPLFQVQWLKCAPSSISHSGTANSNVGSLDPILGDWLKLADESWILYNLEKNNVKCFNAPLKSENALTATPSTLITSLLEHIHVLINNSRESEVEQFVSIQLEFIRKLGEDFGRRLMDVTKLDVNSMPYVGEHDLGLLFSIAGWRYPELSERFFV
ncbi:unnamed protein product [Allacma fusca]|uniref:Uncharacterized protein n=1 Tax=Allacma fusca TaxID=39272 RepID=A0A8J2NXL7_9HEXA|nr:unnamed protein product [Allacma fusca]